MAKIKVWGLQTNEKDTYYTFVCPGCQEHHTINAKWTFNGNVDCPTFNPSVLCQWTFGDEETNNVCHSYVKDGKIQYLGDCTHALKGQTIDLPEYPAPAI